MNNLVIISLEKPTARITEISLHCSYKLPDIEELSEKKQINIVVAITQLKINSNVYSA